MQGGEKKTEKKKKRKENKKEEEVKQSFLPNRVLHLDFILSLHGSSKSRASNAHAYIDIERDIRMNKRTHRGIHIP